MWVESHGGLCRVIEDVWVESHGGLSRVIEDVSHAELLRMCGWSLMVGVNYRGCVGGVSWWVMQSYRGGVSWWVMQS